MKYIGSKSNKNGKLTGHKPTNIKKRAPYGTWKCRFCEEIFETKSRLWEHYHCVHEDKLKEFNESGLIPWNKGLTADTDERIAKGHQTLMARYNSGELKGSWCGRHHTEEMKKHLSEAALKSTHQRICKKTLPYTKTDGTIVNLDSSYERIVAEWLDKNGIDWIRPEPLNWVDSNGITHHYFPDFYLPEKDIYLDPKNEYCFNVQKEKISIIKEQYKNVLFLTKDQISDAFLRKLLLRET